MVTNSQLITKIYFPRLLIPLAQTMAVLLDFFVMLIVLGILLVCFREPITWRVWTFPIFLGLMIIAATGVSLWLSALSVRYRDFIYVVPFLIQIWMFASPVVYPTAQIIPEQWHLIYGLNPAVGFVEGFRWAVLGHGSLSTVLALETFLISLLLFLSGAFFFRRVERGFADMI